MCSSHLSCTELFLQLLVFGLTNGAVLALNAIGVTVVYGAIRTLNLAHGDVFALTSVLVITIIKALGMTAAWPPLLLVAGLAFTLIIAMVFGAVLNVGVERIAFRPFRGRSRLAPLIATLGLSFILYQVALVWRTLLPSWVPHDHRSVPGLPEVPLEDRIPELLPRVDLVKALHLPLHVAFSFADLFVLVVAVLFMLAVAAFLNRTATGRAIRACSQDWVLAQICGVDPDSTLRRAFAFGGALAGAAAFVFALYYTRPFGNHGAQSGLLAFTAAILGGIGSPVGALISALTLGAAGAFSDFYLAAQWTPVLLQALLVGLLILRPTGFAAEERNEDLSASQRDSVAISLSGSRSGLDRRLIWGLLGLSLVYPAIDSVLGLGWQVLLTSIGIYMLLALGLNLLLGVAGILDLGYAVSYGLGGYCAALLTQSYLGVGRYLPQPLDFVVVAMLIALAAGTFGYLKGRLTLRLRSDYLAVVTLAIGLMTRLTIINLSDLTGGAGGLAALPPPTLLSFGLRSVAAQYYLVAVLVIVAAFACQRLLSSHLGRAWFAGSADETAASATGVDVAGYKTLALVVSSVLAGLAGALYAALFAYVSPDMVDFHVSALLLAMVILGGAGSVPGALLGALVIVGYDRLIVPRVGDLLALLWPAGLSLGYAPDIRGASYFNFGLALYLTVLIRARRGHKPAPAELPAQPVTD
jgi:branched-chain amino acid transport system permease protein